MKIFEYTFKIPNLSVKDGKLIDNGYTEETCTFTLLHKGFGLYESLTGKPLMGALLEIEDNMDKVISKDFISNLACASYIKIEGSKFHNNMITAEEFKKSPMYAKTTEDVNFIKGLINMAMDCIVDSNKKVKSKEEKK